MSKTPIFLITGASGSGKTTIISELYKQCPEHIVLDLDALHHTLNDWKLIKNVWIHIANQIALNNRTTILCGTFMPGEFEQADLKDKFQPYFIGLHCTDEVRAARLRTRGWPEELILEHKQFNNWLLNNADKAFKPEMPLIDTSTMLPDKVAAKVKDIVDQTLNKDNI
jgi:broad-specificity NMP kinase